MNKVRAKKHLGQHFLKDQGIAKKIADSLTEDAPKNVLEIGPGMGVLTQFLIKTHTENLFVVEIDRDSVAYLKTNYPSLSPNIIEGDFLKYDLSTLFNEPVSLIGNFPYNISSQILFKMLEHRNLALQLVGMFQREVALRIAAGPGSKTYGILSVLLQTYYDIEYLFTVDEDVFDPPPKVKSGVIRVIRNSRTSLSCDEKLYFRIIKMGFNQRRKTLSNSLKGILLDLKPKNEIFRKRPEQLSVEEFIDLTNIVEELLSDK